MFKQFFHFASILFIAFCCKLTLAGSAFTELKNPSENNDYAWVKNDSTFALIQNGRTIWQYNFNTQYSKPFFHPIHVNNNNITCLRPDDHPWHLGQWFSWKYINEANYWEYLRGRYTSEGVTNIKSIETRQKKDHSAVIILNIEYHRQNEEAVLKEKREIHIAPPQEDGSIWMDYHFSFTALDETVTIDRTPLEHEPNGQSWGGYGGLSIRFNMDFEKAVVISDGSGGDSMHGAKADWLYMGFKGVDGKQVGSVIMAGDATNREGEAWYVTRTPQIPFYFINPAPIFLKPITLQKDKTIHMKYRVLHLEGTVTKEELTKKYNQYVKP